MEVRSTRKCIFTAIIVYSSRADFLLKLQEKLGNGFERFDALDSLGLRQQAVGRAFSFTIVFSYLRITLSTRGRHRKLNYIAMTHPSLSPQTGI